LIAEKMKMTTAKEHPVPTMKNTKEAKVVKSPKIPIKIRIWKWHDMNKMTIRSG
jgi:hypothetical protein